MMVKSKKNKGFTLAEILIVVGIIGVVASMTIPTLLQQNQERATVAALKKTYATLTNAYNLAVQENGDPTNWNMIGMTSATGAQNLLNTLAPYLNITKNCGTSTGCFPTADYKSLHGGAGEAIETMNWKAKAQLADGSLIAVFTRYPGCDDNTGGTTELLKVCADIEVDINGFKQPNTYGKDLFRFWVTKTQLLPKGTPNSTGSVFTFAAGCLANLGETCAAWVIYNENMDYLKCSDLAWSGKTVCN